MTSARQRRIQALDRNGYDLTGHHEKWVATLDYLRFDPATGEILATGTMSVGALDKMAAEFGWSILRQSANLTSHYVDVSGDAPRRRVRSTCPAWLDGRILHDLPVPCRVIVTDETGAATTIACDDASLELGFELPGDYSIRVLSVPHTDGLLTLEVAA